MPVALDLTNQRFGNLTAIEKAPSRNKKTYWLCRCDCGNVKEVQTSHLKSGSIKTCGECEFSKSGFKFEEKEERCVLCGQVFLSNNYARRYCFECSPKGVDPKVALRYKKRAVKKLLIERKGGKCEKCGYDACQGALQFHHANPNEKEFSLAHINFNGKDVSLDTLYKEVDKCVLLCANCHFEEHYLDNIDII